MHLLISAQLQSLLNETATDLYFLFVKSMWIKTAPSFLKTAAVLDPDLAVTWDCLAFSLVKVVHG